MVEILVPMTMFAMVFGIVYVIISFRNRERLALIEKGADASIFKRESHPLRVLKFGLLLVGVAIGIFIGHLLVSSGVMNEEAAYPAMIALFGGLSLIGSYFIEKRAKDKEDQGKSNM
ncbi:MAG: DUF6249 domain-containing protein [Bacteroidota bacterium]